MDPDPGPEHFFKNKIFKIIFLLFFSLIFILTSVHSEIKINFNNLFIRSDFGFERKIKTNIFLNILKFRTNMCIKCALNIFTQISCINCTITN